jgi:hypothetical protein
MALLPQRRYALAQRAAAATKRKRRRIGLLVLSLAGAGPGRPVLAATPPTAWDDSPVGACSTNYALPKPAADDSLAVQPLKHRDAGGNAYVWLWDPTPARNPTRQLVRITPGKVGCTILFMPNADTHDFRLASRGPLPDKVTAASATINDSTGDGHYFEYEYGLDKRSGLYRKVPICFRVSVPGQDRKRVSCDEAMR